MAHWTYQSQTDEERAIGRIREIAGVDTNLAEMLFWDNSLHYGDAMAYAVDASESEARMRTFFSHRELIRRQKQSKQKLTRAIEGVV